MGARIDLIFDCDNGIGLNATGKYLFSLDLDEGSWK